MPTVDLPVAAGFFTAAGFFGAAAAFAAAFAVAGFFGATGRFGAAGFLAAGGLVALVALDGALGGGALGWVSAMAPVVRPAAGSFGGVSAMPGGRPGPADGSGLSLLPATGDAARGDAVVAVGGAGATAGDVVGFCASPRFDCVPDSGPVAESAAGSAVTAAGSVGAGGAVVPAVADDARWVLGLLAALASPSKMPLMMLNMLTPKKTAGRWGMRMAGRGTDVPGKVILFDFAFVCRVCNVTTCDDKRYK